MGTETISIIGWLFGDPLIYTTSMVVARQIVAVRGPLVKPEDSSRGISYALFLRKLSMQLFDVQRVLLQTMGS